MIIGALQSCGCLAPWFPSIWGRYIWYYTRWLRRHAKGALLASSTMRLTWEFHCNSKHHFIIVITLNAMCCSRPSHPQKHAVSPVKPASFCCRCVTKRLWLRRRVAATNWRRTLLHVDGWLACTFRLFIYSSFIELLEILESKLLNMERHEYMERLDWHLIALDTHALTALQGVTGNAASSWTGCSWGSIKAPTTPSASSCPTVRPSVLSNWN